ncbi:DnaJ family domain-containing protein [Cohnella rhizosphaerae]|uniref:DUF1992 domain-containing protein n=1 Tax=Cohnella rhizosphaerae TaxID=1457232 RepID=A0A9X4KYP3_9BACL|nr:DnaJ family domain-containing protein [Cohnella rhizosphaerae]MDG0813260.1 DUF1992 domain-containing protein [Cohnella rhizosphaerae]
MNWIVSIAEQKIRDAEKSGQLEGLPGHGKPLPDDDLAGVPEELRLSYKLLKNAGALPEELQIRKDLVSLSDLLEACRDPERSEKLKGELTEKRLRYRLMMNERGWTQQDAYEQYADAVYAKLTRANDKTP